MRIEPLPPTLLEPLVISVTLKRIGLVVEDATNSHFLVIHRPDKFKVLQFYTGHHPPGICSKIIV